MVLETGPIWLGFCLNGQEVEEGSGLHVPYSSYFQLTADMSGQADTCYDCGTLECSWAAEIRITMDPHRLRWVGSVAMPTAVQGHYSRPHFT